MKAVVITQPGAPEVLQVQEREMPTPAPHQVLVRVRAAGINRPDVAQRKGHYPPPPGAPADVPGLEIAGIVEACGEQVTHRKPGDAVCALLPGGGYAEYAVVDARHCLPLPQNWSFEAASSLPETVFTVWHNVFQRGQLQPGETFLVHGGSSGIGITAIQLAKAWGATVYATAGSDEKCRACEDLGADRCLNYKTEDFEEELKAEGVDVILDMVGGDYISKNLNLLKPDGRLVFINAMQGAQGAFDVRHIMQKRLTITGSTLRPRDADFKAALAEDIEKHVWPLLQGGRFKPVLYQVFDLAEAAQAHALMESSEHIGKIVLQVPE
ncbi:NAD(P)H-quinone oxidoreductase [Rufibacter sediminis]|uniref:NAD(P)H-quinone oxidoreductase n=1 Tax=Rufibacter sediminis TaxID=2762756 RepID=A0ABR6VVH8_9BACT|nr:NAD(P)H-quinone oxidoreductase [Rufibacter sediminis]MBC3541216.1 NAD(P)H-quinone oxidoreductase [Rufibacter sediminis]